MPSRLPAITAWVIAALLIGFAPLFHAICIAPLPPSASGGVTVHAMADGTVMAGGSVMTDPLPPDDPIASGVTSTPADGEVISEMPLAAARPATALLPSIGEIGMILIVAGLAVLTMILFPRWRELARSFGHPPPIVSLVRARPAVAAWRGAAVDLDALGISRT